MSKNWYSRHHLIPKKFSNDFEDKDDVNSKTNIKVIRNNEHIHLHWLHNAATPSMQLMNTIEFNMKVLKKEFIADLIDVLERHYGNYYEIKVYIQEELWKLFELEKNFTNKK